MQDRVKQALAGLVVGLACLGVAVVGAQEKAKVDAAALYKQHCQLCHASGSSPMKNASFADGVWLHGSTVKDVQQTIAKGVPGTVMLGFDGKLKPNEIEALARHVRAFDKTLK